MARIITKKLAEAIAGKLGATKSTKKNRPHDLYTFSYKGKVIAKFSIRRSSDNDIGHDFIPKSLRISTHEAKAFGQCDYTLRWYIEQMKDKGWIEDEGEEEKGKKK